MQCEINDISEFTSLSQQLDVITGQLSNSTGQLNSIIKGAHNYDGIDVVSAANILRSNLKIISSDMRNVSKNISGYLNGINVLNQDDISGQVNSFSFGNIFNSIGNFVSEGVVAPVGNAVARFLPFSENNGEESSGAEEQINV